MRARSLVVVALALPLVHDAQFVSLVYELGGSLPSGEEVIDIVNGSFAVDDDGRWIAVAKTNSSNVLQDEVVLRTSLLGEQEGQPLLAPAGASIGGFDGLDFAGGSAAWVLPLRGLSTEEDSGVFLNTSLLLQEGQVLDDPNVPVGTYVDQLSGFASVVHNGFGDVLIGARLIVPGHFIPNTAGIVRVRVDPVTGQVTSTSVAFLQNTTGANGVQLGNLTRFLAPGRPDWLDMNERGDIAFSAQVFVDGLAADTLLFNDEVVYRQGDALPDGDGTWSTFSNAPVALNDRGALSVLNGVQGGTSRTVIADRDGILVDSTEPFRGAGTPWSILGAPLYMSNQGEVACIAVVPALLTLGRVGIRVQNDYPVRDIQTLLNGESISFRGGFHMSPSGRYLLFELGSAAGSGIGLMDLGLVAPLPGCGSNTATLKRDFGFPLPGETVSFAMNDAGALGSIAYLIVTERPVPGYPPCGVPVLGSELFLDLSNGAPLAVVRGQIPTASGVVLDLPILDDASLVDQTFYGQGVFFGGAAGVSLSNGVAITIGAP